MGRRTILTTDIQDRILQALRSGNYLDTAAAYAGISVATLHEWIARGRAARDLPDDGDNRCPTCQATGDDHCTTAGGKPTKRHTVRPRRPNGDPAQEARYVELVDAVESARASAEVRALANIQKAAGEGTWQAAAWYLERSYPDKWGRRQMQHVGPAGGPVQVDVSVEALEDKLASLLDQAADGGDR